MNRRSLRLTCLVLALAFASGCRSDEDRIREFIERGDAYSAERKFPEAIIEYKNAIQIDPNRAAAHRGLADAHIGNQQGREGLWELQETIRLDPADNEARLRLSQLSILAGDLDGGLEQADQALEHDPTSARAQLLRGQALEARKKEDEALAAYSTGLQLAHGTTDEEDALRLIAGFYTRRGEHDAAGPFYEKRVEVAPEVGSFIALGDHQQRAHHPEAAEAAYRRAVDLAKTSDEKTRAYGTLATFLYDHDRAADAVGMLQKGIADVESPLDLTYQLARLYNLQGADDLADRLIRDAAEQTSGDARPHLVLSAYEEGRGRLAEALAAAERALELSPDDEAAQVWRAELLVNLDQKEKGSARTEQALAAIDRVLKGNPTNPEALAARAKIELIEEHPEAALASLAEAAAARPSWAVPHFRMGSVHSLLGDWPAARTELARAIELDATLVEARRLLVRAHQELGEHEYAIEVGERYLRDRPDDTEIRTRLAQSLFSLNRAGDAEKMLAPIPETMRTPEVRFAFAQLALAAGRTGEARAMLAQALDQRPDSADVLQALLTLDMREKKLDQSVARIQSAIRADPTSARLRQLEGSAAVASGDFRAAEASFRKAIELAPTAPSAALQLAELYLQTGRADDAMRTYEEAIGRNGDEAQLHFRLAILHERRGEADRAIASYEKAIARDPKLAEATNNLAFLLAESDRDLDRALELAQQARKLLPNDPTTADTLGWVYFKRKLPAAAIEYLREAEAGRRPGDPELGAVRHHLALAYEADGQPSQAVDVARRALKELDSARAPSAGPGSGAPQQPVWAADLRALLDRARVDANAHAAPAASSSTTRGT